MIELLSPAGNPEALDAAIACGADAVYLGLKSFNARMRSANFAWKQFEAAVNALHARGKKVYVTVNTVLEECEMERMYRFLAYLRDVGPDALIVQDFGVVRMVQEFFPTLKLHASTQMNIASSEGCNFLLKQGIKRVVLSRELSLDEIRTVAANTAAELEVFCHGALCISESGLCLFSSFLGGKSANRGQCAQACRRLYTADCEDGAKSGYFFSPADLQLVDFVPELMKCGIASLKIEGRMKSAEYVAHVTSAYRFLIDNCERDRKGAIATAKRILANDFARSKTAYFVKNSDAQTVADDALNPDQAGGTGISLGQIIAVRKENGDGDESFFMAKLSGVAETLEVGDSIRLHKKDDSHRESHKIRSIFEDGDATWIHIPEGFSTGDSVYLLQTKAMSKRFPRVIGDLSKFRKQPGDGRLPILDLTRRPKNLDNYFPAGLYIQVSTVKDLCIVQSETKAVFIVELTSDIRENLIERKKTLPVAANRVIVSLDPFCPEKIAAENASLRAELESLVSLGFRTFIANNLAQIPLLKKLGANIIAGPYLYSFNRWAASFLENQGIDIFCSPAESNFANLQATFEPKFREKVLVTLFNYPALFRIRMDTSKKYDFGAFWDKTEMGFTLLPTSDGSFVLPENPFSIIDKRGQLESAGFSRFLVDFSKIDVLKQDFKAIMSAMKRGDALPDTSRFNWKEGFYDAEKIERFKAASERQKSEAASRPQRKGDRFDAKSRRKTSRRAGRR